MQEDAMEHARYVRGSGSFLGGERRSYTRHVWYREDEADFDANMHDEELGARRERSLQELDEDPYAEGGMSDVHEDPGVIAQFRQDLHNPQLVNMVRDNWRTGPGVTLTQRVSAERRAADQVRIRAEILRAVEQARHQQTLMDTDYAKCIPDALRADFLAAPEAEQVCASLVPMLLTQASVHEAVHVTERQMCRILADTGCTFVRAETRHLPGHVADHAPPPNVDDTLYRGTYGDKTDEGLHAHYDAATDTSQMRILTYCMPPDDYHVRVVCHVVRDMLGCEEARVGCAGANQTAGPIVLCFRTFQFMRPQNQRK